jgi:uracil phosphoribosyltransferase
LKKVLILFSLLYRANINNLPYLGLNHLPVIDKSITTPTGNDYEGIAFEGRICGVSIMRAGEAMEQGLRECCRFAIG